MRGSFLLGLLFVVSLPAFAVSLDAQGHPLPSSQAQPSYQVQSIPARSPDQIKPATQSCFALRNRYELLERRLHAPGWTKQDLYEAQEVWAGIQRQGC